MYTIGCQYVGWFISSDDIKDRQMWYAYILESSGGTRK